MADKLYLVLFGPPGAGKGTQSHRITEALRLPRLATGEIFREHLKNKTDLGMLAASYFQQGKLVPDEVTVKMVAEMLDRPIYSRGALLDGFPRTITQSKALDQLAQENDAQVLVASILVPESVLVERLSERYTCRAQGHTFHLKLNPPQKPGVCDFDGSELYQRADDCVETVQHRIGVYLSQTMPVIHYYREQGHLFEVDGTANIDEVTQALLNGIALHNQKHHT